MEQWHTLIEGDMELVDGLEELDEASQEKVKRALKQGHVDDEDWRGVSCLYQQLNAILTFIGRSNEPRRQQEVPCSSGQKAQGW